jgi:hypothetical protein
VEGRGETLKIYFGNRCNFFINQERHEPILKYDTFNLLVMVLKEIIATHPTP